MYIPCRKGANRTLCATLMESVRIDVKSVKSKVEYLRVVIDKEKGSIATRRGVRSHTIRKRNSSRPPGVGMSRSHLGTSTRD